MGVDSHPATRTRRVLIDCEEDRILRAVLVGMLRESGQLTKEGRQTDRIPSYMGNRSRESGSGFGLSEQDGDQQKEGRPSAHFLIS